MAIDDNREKQDKVYVSFVKLVLRERKNMDIYHFKKVILAMKEREKMAPNDKLKRKRQK